MASRTGSPPSRSVGGFRHPAAGLMVFVQFVRPGLAFCQGRSETAPDRRAGPWEYRQVDRRVDSYAPSLLPPGGSGRAPLGPV